METEVMRKTEWNAPKLEILSTRKTAAGGTGPNDLFHTADSAETPQPTARDNGGTS